MIKVFIADDHAVVRRGIKQILAGENNIEVVGEASNADETLSQIYKTATDILILDITMPGKNGLDVLIQVKERKPELNILILSMHPEEEVAIRAIKSGASGYLNKDSVPDELITAVKKINNGGRYISSSLAESIVQAASDSYGSSKSLQVPRLLLRFFSVRHATPSASCYPLLWSGTARKQP